VDDTLLDEDIMEEGTNILPSWLKMVMMHNSRKEWMMMMMMPS
jgi:hypothetical protein